MVGVISDCRTLGAKVVERVYNSYHGPYVSILVYVSLYMCVYIFVLCVCDVCHVCPVRHFISCHVCMYIMYVMYAMYAMYVMYVMFVMFVMYVISGHLMYQPVG